MQKNRFSHNIAHVSIYLEARWPSGKALDSGARGWRLEPQSGRRVVSLSKTHLLPISTGNTLEGVAQFGHD